MVRAFAYRVSAMGLCFGARRLVAERPVRLVAATAHDDVRAWLAPSEPSRNTLDDEERAIVRQAHTARAGRSVDAGPPSRRSASGIAVTRASGRVSHTQGSE